MKWTVEFIKEAQKDLKRLDPYNQKIILKAISKTAERPLPPPDGVGKPLGNHASANLSGFYKIKLRIAIVRTNEYNIGVKSSCTKGEHHG